MSAPNQALIDQFELPHTGEGSPFQISVARVTGLSSDMADVPVFFVMDADFEFAVAAEIVRLASMGGTRPGAIVVGIGYGTTDFSTFSQLRTSDLTPAIRAENIQSLVGLTALIGERYGGAEALLTFLIETLVPEIAHRYPDASTSNRALFGHSLGGLFTVYALLSRPDAFAAFFPASPSLWWNGFALFDELSAFAARLDAAERKPRLFISVGGDEQVLPTQVPPGGDSSLAEVQAMIGGWRMVDAAREFAAAVREAGLADAGCTVFADEDHHSVIPAAMMRSVTLFLSPPGPNL